MIEFQLDETSGVATYLQPPAAASIGWRAETGIHLLLSLGLIGYRLRRVRRLP